MVDEIAIRCTNVPLAPDGLALATASAKALMFSTSLSAANYALPTPARTIPAFSTRNSTLVALATQVQSGGRRARIVANVDAIVQLVSPELNSGDVVAILSNGGFGGIYAKLPERLRAIGAPRKQDSSPGAMEAKAKV
jgi:hypothetical protein